jgi:hypothetical protein
VAARLLASGADIDPECSYALRQLAGSAAPDDQPVGGPFVRLDSHGRLRWPRGTWNCFFVAVMFIPAGLFVLFAAAPGVPRGWGLLILAFGLISGALPVHGRFIDSKKLGQSHR